MRDESDMRAPRGLLPSLAIGSFVVGIDSLLVVPLLPAIAKAAAIQPEHAVLLVTAYAMAYMLTAPLFGTLSDHRGRRSMILAGIVVLGTGTVFTGFAEGFVGLLSIRALTGVGAGMIEPNVFAMVGDHFSYTQRGRAMGVVVGAMIAATIIGVPLGGLLAQLMDWRMVFWLTGALAFLLIIPVSRGIPIDSARSVSHIGLTTLLKPVQELLSHATVQRSLLVTCLWYGGLQGMFANVGMFYSQAFHLNTAQTGGIILLAGMSSVAGSLAGGRVADSWGKKPVFLLFSTVTALAVLALPIMTEALYGAVVVHVLWATSFGAGQATLSAVISELLPDARGTVLSLNSAAMFAGMMAATGASSLALSLAGFESIGLMCAACVLLAIPLSEALFARNKIGSCRKEQDCFEQ